MFLLKCKHDCNLIDILTFKRSERWLDLDFISTFRLFSGLVTIINETTNQKKISTTTNTDNLTSDRNDIKASALAPDRNYRSVVCRNEPLSSLIIISEIKSATVDSFRNHASRKQKRIVFNMWINIPWTINALSNRSGLVRRLLIMEFAGKSCK